jgi:hypothetical protein
MAGHRDGSNGSLSNVGSSGNYWSSTVVGNPSGHWYISFHSSYAGNGLTNMASGTAVRCLKD